MDSAMDLTPPKKIRKLDSDVGTDLYDKPKSEFGESQTIGIQVKDDENENKSKIFEKSENIAPDHSSPPKKIQNIQSIDDQLMPEDNESKSKIDTDEEASGGETNGSKMNKRHRKPDNNKSDESATSPPKKAQKIDSLSSAYDHKTCEALNTSGNQNENTETIEKFDQGKVGKFDLSETLPAKVAALKNEQMVPDRNSGDSNVFALSKVQRSSFQKDPSNEEEITKNKDVCLSSSVCGENIEAKNAEEKNQHEKGSDHHKNTKEWQEDISESTGYKFNNGQETNVGDNICDDRTGTCTTDNEGRNEVAFKEPCEVSAQNKSDESSIECPKTLVEKDIITVQNRQPSVIGIEAESPCVAQDTDPHPAKEKDSMNNSISAVKESVISEDVEKPRDTEEKEENITDLKIEVIKSDCDVSGFGDSQNKVECQNSVTELKETVSNKATKCKVESQAILSDTINQSLLHKDDLSDLHQYKKPKQSEEIGRDNVTAKNTELSDLPRDMLKHDSDLRQNESDKMKSNVTNEQSETVDQKNVSLGKNEYQNPFQEKGVCDAIDNKTETVHTKPERESLSKDSGSNEDDNGDLANNMAVDQKDYVMKHDDTVKNNVECPEAAEETSEDNANSVGNEGSVIQDENCSGKSDSQLPENCQKENITGVSDTVNAKPDTGDKKDDATLENSNCQISKNEKNSANTENSDGVLERSKSEELNIGKIDQKVVDNSECNDSFLTKKSNLTDSEIGEADARSLAVDITLGSEKAQESDKETVIVKPDSKATELNNTQNMVEDINTKKDATDISNDNPSDKNCSKSVVSQQNNTNIKPDLLAFDISNSVQNMKSQQNDATDEAVKIVGDMELDSVPSQESEQIIPDKIQDIVDDATSQSNIVKDGDKYNLEHEAKLQESAEIKENTTDVKSIKLEFSNETELNPVANKIEDSSMSRNDAVTEPPDEGKNSAVPDNECQHGVKQESGNVVNNKIIPNEDNGTTLQKDGSSREVNVEANDTKIDMVIEPEKCQESVIAEGNDECYDSKDRKEKASVTDDIGRNAKEHDQSCTNRDDTEGLEPNIPGNKTANYFDGQSLTDIAPDQHEIDKDDNDLSVSQSGKRLETEGSKENISDVKESKQDGSIETGVNYAVDDEHGGENDEPMEVDADQEEEVCKDSKQKFGNDGVASGGCPESIECDAVQNEDYAGCNKENGSLNEDEKHKSLDPDLECQVATKGDKGVCNSIGKNTSNNGDARAPETEEMKNLTKDAEIIKSEECVKSDAAVAEADCKDNAKEKTENASKDEGDSLSCEVKEFDPVIDNGLSKDPAKAEITSANNGSGEPDGEDVKLSQDSSTKVETFSQ